VSELAQNAKPNEPPNFVSRQLDALAGIIPAGARHERCPALPLRVVIVVVDRDVENAADNSGALQLLGHVSGDTLGSIKNPSSINLSTSDAGNSITDPGL